MKVTDLLFFHGQREGWEEKVETRDLRIFGDDALWFTTNPDYALGFANVWSGVADAFGRVRHGWLHAAHLEFSNPKKFDANNPDEFEAFHYRGYSRADLEQQGYDALLMHFTATEESAEEWTVGVFSPRQVKPWRTTPLPATNQLLYTVGGTDGYESYLREDPMAAKGIGGSVWRTQEEAEQHCRPGFSVYGVDALWGAHTRPDGSETQHELMLPARLVKKSCLPSMPAVPADFSGKRGNAQKRNEQILL